MALVRVLFVEDESWVRTGVAKALAADPQLFVTTCSQGRAAIAAITAALAAASVYDVALVDIGLPDVSGLDVIAALRKQMPECAPVMFTKFDDPATILEALRAGARGYLLKSTPTSRIVPSLREAMAGGMPLSPAVASLVVAQMLATAPTAPTTPALTPRESELLGLIAKGSTYAECAAELGIGLGTVQSYIKTIYSKLDVSSKAEAAVAAVRLGLVE